MNSAFRLTYNGHVFAIEVILNYLLNGQLVLADDRIKKELLVEAKFYQIQGIIEELGEKNTNASWYSHLNSGSSH